LDIEKYNIKEIVKYTGAFIAWVVGSGFATGQEILRFFASYGYASYGVVLLDLFGFLFFGQIMLRTGFKHREEKKFNHYYFYCGNKLGAIYSWLVPVILVLLMSVLISASGATLSEYYGINHYIGSAIMAIMVLGAYLVGFDKLVKIVAAAGPLIVVFALTTGTVTVITDFTNFNEISRNAEVLLSARAAPNWALSAVLYLSLTFLCGSTYYTALGRSAENKNSITAGGVAGAVAVILVILIMNTAILLNAGDTALLSVPTLYLAKKFSYVLGAAFSVVLLLGTFSSCSAMMWSFCSKFFSEGDYRNRLIAVFTSVVTFIIGLFSFRGLVGLLYPFFGYIGLIFITCVAYKGAAVLSKK
jgi:uncharacterized membrane protein YkvI